MRISTKRDSREKGRERERERLKRMMITSGILY